MNKRILIYLTLGLVTLLTFCKKDETRVIMLDNPVAPVLTAPSLALSRANGANAISFAGTKLNVGFQASVSYYLEADAVGNNFKNALVVYNGIQDTLIKFTVADLNTILLKKFNEDVTTPVELRLRAVVVADAGTGVAAKEYSSNVVSTNITLYGLPRLDLISGSEVIGKVQSPLGDGNYSGYVKLDAAKPVQFKNPDNGKVYGGGASISEGGAAISISNSGYYKVAVSTVAKTSSMEAYMIGLVGSATPNGWNSPDSKMDYDSKSATWKITINLTDDQVKFRLNDGWATNWGGKGTADGSADNYASDGVSVPLTAGGKNIALKGGAGNYTITLDIANSTAKIVKN